jgi:universal stress protein E
MTTPIRRLVVGVASVDELDPVLPCAIRLAERVAARLHVVHVVDLPEYPFLEDAAAFGAVGPAGLAAEFVREVERRLREQVERFAPAAGAVAVHALRGAGHRRLTEFVDEVGAELLVVGATRRGRIWRNALGTTTERVLRASTVPVLVVHRPFFHPVARVLLTTDLSDVGPAIHEQAADLVESLFGGNPLELRVLFVLSDPLLPPTYADSLLQERARESLREFVAGRAPRELPVSTCLRQGDPAVEINREAEEWRADLLVLGTHGRRGVSRFVFGSVAAAALRDSPRNVLVVPAGRATGGGRRDAATDQRRELAGSA